MVCPVPAKVLTAHDGNKLKLSCWPWEGDTKAKSKVKMYTEKTPFILRLHVLGKLESKSLGSDLTQRRGRGCILHSSLWG
jgi:hypothetical protein